jgi:hypothetical protein
VPDPSEGVSQGEQRPVVEHLGVAQTVRARADADTSPQRKDLGMVYCQSPLPRASRQVSTDPNGCPRQLPRIARGLQTRVSLAQEKEVVQGKRRLIKEEAYTYPLPLELHDLAS